MYQGRFRSFPVQTDDDFYQVVRYVERNALRANLVERGKMKISDCLTGCLFRTTSAAGIIVRGRVTIDIEFIRKKRLLPGGSPIAGHSDAVLVEVYHSDMVATPNQGADAQKQVAIRGAYVDRASFFEPLGVKPPWEVYGQRAVTVDDIDFPQALIGFMHDGGAAAFEWGELKVPLPMDHDSLHAFRCYATRLPTKWFAEYALMAMGMAVHIPEPFRTNASLGSTDLRFNEKRKQVYKWLKCDATLPYSKIQKEKGLDTARLLAGQSKE